MNYHSLGCIVEGCPIARGQIAIPIRSFCNYRLIPGSVSPARWPRSKANFLLDVITRSQRLCTHIAGHFSATITAISPPRPAR